MNKEQIWEVLQTCLLATDGAGLDYLVKKGFSLKISKIGIKLCEYLKSKEI